MNPLTIVMYHYVRPLAGSRYPGLKGLELDLFRGQLDFIGRHYRVVTMQEVVAASRGETTLAPRSLLLTFDDGYRDHHDYVLPELVARGWQGSFFPPVRAIRERSVLDVNKIHFALAGTDDTGALVHEILTAIDENRDAFRLRPSADYYREYAKPGRYDNPPVIFIKRILQKGLPSALSAQITQRLFHRFVTEDAASFADDLYMNHTQLGALRDAGMFIGSHGDRHLWLNTLDDDEQALEVEAGLKFLDELGVSRQDWVMCYPYGGYDDRLLALLRRYGCAAGLTVEPGLTDPCHQDPLCLPRVDTNDLPVSLDASPSAMPWVKASFDLRHECDAATDSRWGRQ
ncbi:polysaccharide deacetylase family protein [Halomonas sp. LR5S13]|uniref:polysaccharide deacetylase family protein n=1 Tax=Halomonas rhizosphaerae TaxID=3043296 RepID=UPI0024A8696E|nr:polysaccharide deacetylase family protein [Halomonas rhizosphaerae]MDI5920861.1 polysaccharide deacetylase family protein [Halomonas rhizosphaerae]